MEIFVARRPVFDASKDVTAYELPYRPYSGESDNGHIDAESFQSFIDYGNVAQLADRKIGCVLLDPNTLPMPMPELAPSQHVWLGISPDLQADDATVARCQELRSGGYTLMLKHFSPDHRDSPLLDLVDIVRVNLREFTAQQHDVLCGALKEAGITPLSMNVQTPEEADRALQCGYTYLQGDFFTKPNTAGTGEAKMSAGKLNCLLVLKEINRSELDYRRIEQLIKQDVEMTYQLLQFVNSPRFNIKHEIDSVKRALVMLGPVNVRKWLSIFMLRYTGAEKPNELIHRSLSRASTAEHLAPLCNLAKRAPEMFLMGMFSLIDALADAPMGEALTELPISEEVRSTLMETGPYTPLYRTLLTYEDGDWDGFLATCNEQNIDPPAAAAAMRQGLRWATQILSKL
ncbi:MAG: HDOD domain-containing protein [Planctomycetes bacterium]|jgi:EAL and modified HD-GYP domain-containing signal transduction protein|nr:HDOD domain-containing protein [Planctomycetota bacterium]